MSSSSYHIILSSGFLSPYTITRELREYLEGDINLEDREALEIEIKCFDFYMNNGTLVPLREQRDKNGDIISTYPDIRLFSELQWEYLEHRLEKAQHPFLDARYAHLLWMRNSHNKYAVKAINSYKSLVEIYLSIIEEGDNRFSLLCKTVGCYHLLSSITKHETEVCKKNMLGWLRKDIIPITWKGRIVRIITDSSLFKSIDLEGLTMYMLIQVKSGKYGYTQTKDLLEALLLLTNKEKFGNKDVLNLLGENELLLASKRDQDETGMIAVIAYQRAAD
jgi:hypothetical protein